MDTRRDSATAAAPLADVERAIRDLPDPEIPVISIEDLGIVRAVEVVAGGAPDGAPGLSVRITPTYSGCPAVEAIAQEVRRTASAHGWVADVETVLSPAWSTDWMSEAGKERLRRFGIAPPGPVPTGPRDVDLRLRRVDCPACGSPDTEELSRFGGTACKALRRCRACSEPFEEFKTL